MDIKRCILLLVIGVFPSSFVFSDGQNSESSTDRSSTVEIEYLLKNKGFLDATASGRISELSSVLSEIQRFQLYERFRLRPGSYTNLFALNYERFPKYEDQTWNLIFGIGGVAGTVSSTLLAMTSYEPNKISPLTGVGLGGVLLFSIPTMVYFLGLPAWNPRAYDTDTVNSEIREVLGLHGNF